MSRDAARLTENFVFTVGVGDDFVMRLGVDSIENLRTGIIQTLHASRLPKVRLNVFSSHSFVLIILNVALLRAFGIWTVKVMFDAIILWLVFLEENYKIIISLYLLPNYICIYFFTGCFATDKNSFFLI